MLTSEQRAFFWENGYLAIQDFLSAEELASVRQALDELVAKAQGLRANTKVYDVEAPADGGPTVVRRIFNPAQVDERFERIATSPKVLDVVEDLIGPDIQFHHGKINMKSAKGGAEVGWHQDLPFFPHTNSDLLACMCYLDDSTEENGCLMVVPGSHRLGPLDHFADGMFIGMVTDDLAKVDLGRAAKLPIRAGGVTIHHCLTLHSSARNTSSQQRRVLIYQYRAADAVQLTPEQTSASHYGKLLRGREPGTIRLESRVFKLPNHFLSGRQRSLYELQEDYRRQHAERTGAPAR